MAARCVGIDEVQWGLRVRNQGTLSHYLQEVVVLARTCTMFARMGVLARPVFAKCLRTPTCSRGDATTHVFARPVFGKRLCPPMSHVSSRRRASSPHLSSGRVFARPRVFAATRAFARAVFGNCPLVHTWFHFWECLGKDSALGRPGVFAVFAWHMSDDSYVSSQTMR